MEKEIKELINKAESIYDEILDSGGSFDWLTERELIQALGRLELSESDAIKIIKAFIENLN